MDRGVESSEAQELARQHDDARRAVAHVALAPSQPLDSPFTAPRD